MKNKDKVVHKNVNQGCHMVRQFYSKKYQETFSKNDLTG